MKSLFPALLVLVACHVSPSGGPLSGLWCQGSCQACLPSGERGLWHRQRLRLRGDATGYTMEGKKSFFRDPKCLHLFFTLDYKGQLRVLENAREMEGRVFRVEKKWEAFLARPWSSEAVLLANLKTEKGLQKQRGQRLCFLKRDWIPLDKQAFSAGQCKGNFLEKPFPAGKDLLALELEKSLFYFGLPKSLEEAYPLQLDKSPQGTWQREKTL